MLGPHVPSCLTSRHVSSFRGNFAPTLPQAVLWAVFHVLRAGMSWRCRRSCCNHHSRCCRSCCNRHSRSRLLAAAAFAVVGNPPRTHRPPYPRTYPSGRDSMPNPHCSAPGIAPAAVAQVDGAQLQRRERGRRLALFLRLVCHEVLPRARTAPEPRRSTVNNSHMSPACALLRECSGGIAGAAAGLLTNPLDLVKLRIQASHSCPFARAARRPESA